LILSPGVIRVPRSTQPSIRPGWVN